MRYFPIWRTRACLTDSGVRASKRYRPVKDCRSSECIVYASGHEVGIVR